MVTSTNFTSGWTTNLTISKFNLHSYRIWFCLYLRNPFINATCPWAPWADAFLNTVPSCETRSDPAEECTSTPSQPPAQSAAGAFNVTLTSIREQLRNCLGLWGYMLLRLSITFNCSRRHESWVIIYPVISILPYGYKGLHWLFVRPLTAA